MEERKRNFDLKIVIIGAFLALILITSGGVLHERDWHDFHKWECEQCHENNGTFLLCSGGCIEPSENDTPTGCMFPPTRNCEEVPHGSLISSGLKNTDGLCFPFTQWCWIIF